MWTFYVGRIALNSIFRLLFSAKTTDVATRYKLVRAEVAKLLRLHCCRFDLDFELASSLSRLGYDIAELPISYRPRTFAEGKKIRPIDGLRAIRAMLQIRLLPRHALMRSVTAS